MPDSDRIIVTQLTGAVQRHAGWRELSESETAAAVTELQEIIGDRPDGAALLAEVAGILIGTHEGALDELRALAAAQLCIDAGADKALIPRWIEEGRRRADNARRMPWGGRPRRFR